MENPLIDLLEKYLEDEVGEFSGMLSSEFISFFLNLVHNSSSKLFDIKNVASPATKSEQKSKTGKGIHGSHKKRATLERISTPKSVKSSHLSSSKTPTRTPEHKEDKRNRKSFNRSGCCQTSGSQNILSEMNTSASNCNFPLLANKDSGVNENASFDTNAMKHMKIRSRSVHTPDQLFDISSSNDFPSLSGNKDVQVMKPVLSVQKRNVRRIKPTLVTTQTTSSEKCRLFKGDANTQEVNLEAIQTKTRNDLKREREMLLKTRIFATDKCSNADVESLQVDCSLEAQLQYISPIKTEEIAATNLKQQSVTFPKKLKRLVGLYATHIDRFNVSSVMAELHMLIMLLLIDDHLVVPSVAGPSDIFATLLNTSANAKYFASLTLEKLSENGFLAVFSSETLPLLLCHLTSVPDCEVLKTTISHEIETRSQEKSCSNISAITRTGHTSVPFKPDTDDRSNFVNDKAFYSFRKQRDMFYTLIRHWNNIQASTENISRETVGQLRWLVTQVKTQATYDAFLRLFVDHMLCVGTPGDDGTTHTGNFPLTSLLNGDSEKLRRLENRVTKPSVSRLNNSHTRFHKELRFFRDFVAIADSFTLNVRLCDILQIRITQIESENCQVDNGSNCDANMEFENIYQAIQNLQICGNFYGFVVFYPYKDSGKSCGLSHMEFSAASFISAALERALKNGHLTFTVPWVVQFLTHINLTCIREPTFANIFHTLCGIYRLTFHNHLFKLFLCAVIGSLFEQDFFDDETFYEYMKIPLKIPYKSCTNSVDCASHKLITPDLIYEMHWRLSEVKTLLKSKSTSMNRRQLPKKIKPSSEKLPESSNLQSTLEASFFRNQPLSLKRTVVFVTERCHSNCIKHLCSTALPLFCEQNETMSKYAQDEDGDGKVSDIIRELAVKVYPDAMSHLKEVATQFNAENVTKCMEVLASSTLPASILEMATQIAERQSVLSISNWLNERLFDHLVSKIKLSISSKPQEHKPLPRVGMMTSSVIHRLRECVLENQSSADTERVAKMVKEQLTAVSSIIAPPSGNSDGKLMLPSHILSVVSFLVRELLTLLSSDALPNPVPLLEGLEIADVEKSPLIQLLQTHN